jgi:hypothetical protein
MRRIGSCWKSLQGKFPFFLILVAVLFSFWLMFHTFSYDEKRHEIRIAFKLWSDFGAHIPLIRSFSMGGNWPIVMRQTPIEYPIYPGEPIRYHFLFDMIVGILERMGLRIDWALNVPSALGFFGMLMGVYLLAYTLFGSRMSGILSVIFLLFNGSLGFLRFFANHPLSLSTLQDIWRVKDFPSFAPWGPGDVTAFWNLNIYTNQRHLAIAFAMTIGFIISMLKQEHHTFKKQFPMAILWGVLFGFLPYFHQPTLLVIALLLIWYILALPRLRLFLLTVSVVSGALILPQVLMSPSGAPGIEWHPGYIIHNEIIKMSFPANIVRVLTFWWHNIGVHIFLIPIGFFLIPKRARIILFPLLPLFMVAVLFKFSIEVSANHKFFNFVMILGHMLSAYVLVWFIRLTKQFHLVVRSFAYSLVGIFLILLTLSGVIDFFVVANDTKGAIADIPRNETATWIAQHTPPDAVFLNSNYLYHPASLAGRPIFLGWPYFAWSAGYEENRMPVMDTLYETRDTALRCDMLRKRNISYVTVENIQGDVNLPDIDMTYYLKTFTPAFVSRDQKYAIFTQEELCK